MTHKEITKIRKNYLHLKKCCNLAFENVKKMDHFGFFEKESMFYLLSLKNIFTSLGISENQFDDYITPILNTFYEELVK